MEAKHLRAQGNRKWKPKQVEEQRGRARRFSMKCPRKEQAVSKGSEVLVAKCVD